MSDTQNAAELSFKPIAKAESLLLGDVECPVAVCCLWSVKDKIARRTQPRCYAVIGNLYSGERGLDPLIRNLLANPSIKHLVICGDALTDSREALTRLFTDGFEEGTTLQGKPAWVVDGSARGYIGLDIPKRDILELIFNLDVHVVEKDELNRTLETLRLTSRRPLREAKVYPPPPPDLEDQILYPNETAGFSIHAPTIAYAWLELLNLILYHGREVGSSYKERTKEVLNLSVTIPSVAEGGDDPVDMIAPDWMGLGRERVNIYFQTKLLQAGQGGEANYTYADRMRAWFRKPPLLISEGGTLVQVPERPVDQLECVVNKLVKDWDECKSAVVSYWDPTYDNEHGGSPCFNQAWFRIRDGALHATVVIRSNDMFSAWPENAYGFRCLQDHVRFVVQQVSGRELKLGAMTTFSESAHIYADTWEAADALLREPRVEKYWGKRQLDPRGSFVITNLVAPDGHRFTNLEHLTPQGERVLERVGQPTILVEALAPYVSRIDHALYLGRELAKAELALRFPDLFTYVQDRPLQRRSEDGEPSE